MRTQPKSTAAWCARARTLVDIRRPFDAVASLASIAEVSSEAAGVLRAAQESLRDIILTLQPLLETVSDVRATKAARIVAFRAILDADPTHIYARAQATSFDLQSAVALRKEGADTTAAVAIAREQLELMSAALSDLHAYSVSRDASPPTHQPAVPSLDALYQRRPNLAAVQQMSLSVARKLEGLLELNLGVATEMIIDEDSGGAYVAEGVAAGGEAAKGEVEHEGAYEQRRLLALRRAAAHYARAAAADGHGERANSIFTKWGAVVEQDPAEGRAGAQRVWESAVAAGLWIRPEQRPVKLLRELTAAPWHEPYAHPVCCALRDAYRVIREEAMTLLAEDSAAGGAAGCCGSESAGTAAASCVFLPYPSKALQAGEWADVGLFYNARINSQANSRAPRTTAFLQASTHGLLHDALSCPLGSVYFSLLRPHTSLKAHCGPTNARLRAHLGLLIPKVPPSTCT